MTAFKGDKAKPGSIRMRQWREKNKESYAEYQRTYKRSRREDVIAYYGAKCVCCGETQFEFLALDHIDGGGNKHREELFGYKGASAGSKMIDWILKNKEYPDFLQILCHNCNMAKGFYGKCPHQGDE